MCFSAMVIQNVKSLSEIYGAQIDYSVFEEMYSRRLEDSSIKIGRGVDEAFQNPQNSSEAKIHGLIQAYKDKKTSELEVELFRQKKRLADAERKSLSKVTKKAQDDIRIATSKIKWHTNKILDLKRDQFVESDNRIFPMSFAPIIVSENGHRTIKLARYHLRPNGKPASIDKKFDGLYNARTDNLTNNFWKPLFGKQHAFFAVTSFFENVARHDYENRELKDGEKEENIVLHFTPSASPMIVTCLYDYWGKLNVDGFYSFAALTGEPTKEISDTGHDRLIISISEESVSDWLNPESKEKSALIDILSSKIVKSFTHNIAA